MRAQISTALLVVLLAVGAVAAPTDAHRRAIQDGVGRGVVEPAIAEELEKAEWVRIVVVFAPESGGSPAAVADAALERVAKIGFAPVRRFYRLPVLIGHANAAALAALLGDPRVVRIGTDGLIAPQLAEAVPLVNLDDLHAQGSTGNGVRVAILDTGVDLVHPDLAGAVVSQRCFCDDGQPGPAGCCPNGLNSQSGAGAAQDDHGHGTLLAGIVTSAGVHAPLGGAPGAELVAVKMLSASGSGVLSDLLAGLDWVLQFQPDVSVVNVSLGGGLYAGNCDGADATTMALASAVDQLYAAGVVTVASSGNNQSGTAMVAPACVARAVSVGAVWDASVGSQTFYGCTDATTAADQVACWSNSSNTTDVFAPGGRITSSLLGGTVNTLAGTSLAVPIVSGCAAVLMGKHPSATPQEIADALRSSPVSVVDATNGLSFPRLDCLAADQYLSSSSVPSLSRGAAVLLLVGIAMAALGSMRAMRTAR